MHSVGAKCNLSFCHFLCIFFLQKSSRTGEKGGTSRLRPPGPATYGLPQRTQHHWGMYPYSCLCVWTCLSDSNDLNFVEICSQKNIFLPGSLCWPLFVSNGFTLRSSYRRAHTHTHTHTETKMDWPVIHLAANLLCLFYSGLPAAWWINRHPWETKLQTAKMNRVGNRKAGRVYDGRREKSTRQRGNGERWKRAWGRWKERKEAWSIWKIRPNGKRKYDIGMNNMGTCLTSRRLHTRHGCQNEPCLEQVVNRSAACEQCLKDNWERWN